MGRRWAEAELELLHKGVHAGWTWERIGREINRTAEACKSKASARHLHRQTSGGRVTLEVAARALCVDSSTIRKWGLHGLRIVGSGAWKGPRKGKLRLVDPEDLSKFINKHPELYHPDLWSPRLMARNLGRWFHSSLQKTNAQWKHLTCPLVDRHGSGEPAHCWAPMYNETARCPECGRQMPKVATVSPDGVRHKAALSPRDVVRGGERERILDFVGETQEPVTIRAISIAIFGQNAPPKAAIANTNRYIKDMERRGLVDVQRLVPPSRPSGFNITVRRRHDSAPE